MNLIPTLISIGLATSFSIFYLQNQSDEPNKINYRAALSEFEQSAIAFAAHTPLDSNNPQPESHCQNLESDFSKWLPASSQWTVNIAGLDCDMAVLSLKFEDSDDFNNLLSAANASGRGQSAKIDISTKTIEWTQRLYTRSAADLGIRAKLKHNSTNACLAKKCIKNNPTSATVVNKAPTDPNQTKQPKNPNNGTWHNTGKCNKKCGIGKAIYVCIGKVGQVCDGASPVEKCNTHPCPIDGKWSEWKSCSKKCGGGTQTRDCNSPKPQHEGKKCLTEENKRALKEEKSCNTDHCPIDGGWSEWSQCSEPCGNGHQKQYCNRPEPQYNGMQCKKDDGTTTTKDNNYQKQVCIIKPCNQPPVIKNQEFDMRLDTSLVRYIVATDPENKNLTFSLMTRNLGTTEIINSNEGKFKYTRNPGTNKLFSYSDAKNNTNELTTDHFIVRVTDPEGLFAEATMTINIYENNDPPSIFIASEYPGKPLFDREFRAEFKIEDPDYDFNSLPRDSYEFSLVPINTKKWLECNQANHQVGSMLIICKGYPNIKNMDNDPIFTVNIKFNDGLSKAEKSFKFETIDAADYFK